MKIAILLFTAFASLTLSATSLADDAENDINKSAKKLYTAHCQSCHGIERLGAMGPALLPENLSRLRKPKATRVINEGRVATQMPSFNQKLTSNEIAQLVDYIYTPTQAALNWNISDIKASNIVHFDQKKLAEKPVFEADMMNLFIIVELGDHSATLLNGDTFEPIDRFKTRFALHGGPKYSPDGRYVFFASRDGWISKYDIYNLKTVVEVRAAINTRNIAISNDGQHLIVGNYLPNNVVILNTRDLSPAKVIDTIDSNGVSSRVSAVYNAPPRHSFIVALKDVKEIWEIPYSDQGGVEVYKGWAHDYRKDGGEGKLESWKVEDPFPIRRIETDDFITDFFFDPQYINLIGTARNNHNGQVINLDTKKKIAAIALTGMPHLGSGITWDYQGKAIFASPNIKEGKITVIDMDNWQVIKEIKTEGPGFFMRSHDNSPYAWADVFFGPNKEKVHVIDKRTLEIVKTIAPSPGKNAAHVEFTKDGKYVLLSVWDEDGELIVYDANTLAIVKRLPMKKPSGKYNVYNKTHYERGTSH
ncbi:cytochrome D1 domain-containing protein [Colwellia hornerae]|uniref:C-type cytochrome n=1 Tax=Colwellia hornerae TaxID=89402 RepID=A0A5C6Q674_9GAMM|nr:cytochrome D1 domain-containing protein [Colwellia hornerae]TWX59509.1 c-type cytochrome [Colwellia hornerae]TWX62879.1 c-type cytochrome [Colwellia hornerae]TWX64201.1 c-type cytochrome [Colwellia hornerae]